MTPEEFEKGFTPRFYKGGKDPEIERLPEFEPRPMELEIVDETLFDTVCLPKAGNRITAFVSPVGTADHGSPIPRMKTWNHTNMVQCGALPAPQKMLVESWTCHFLYEGRIVPLLPRKEWWRVWEPRLFHSLYQETRLRFEISRKSYGDAAAFEIVDFAWLREDPERLPRGVFSRAVPIEQMESFCVTVLAPDKEVPPGYAIWIGLHGKMLRPIC